MPPAWKDMDCEEIWRGLSKGEHRPAIDVAHAKKMMMQPLRRADARFSDDKQANNGKPAFLINECKQKYMRMHWKHENAGPAPFCALCKKDAWGSSHVYSNTHLNNILTLPYNWSMDSFSPPDPEEIGVQDPRTHGITFRTLAEDAQRLVCEGPHAFLE